MKITTMIRLALTGWCWLFIANPFVYAQQKPARLAEKAVKMTSAVNVAWLHPPLMHGRQSGSKAKNASGRLAPIKTEIFNAVVPLVHA